MLLNAKRKFVSFKKNNQFDPDILKIIEKTITCNGEVAPNATVFS